MVTLILMSLSDNFFCFSASFRLRLSSSRRFLFSSSRCRFFSSSLLLLSSLFSSLILCKGKDDAHCKICFTSLETINMSTFFLSYLFLNFLIFDVLQQRCGPFCWNRQINRSHFVGPITLRFVIILWLCDLPMSSLVFASISPNRVSGLAIDFSSSQE